MDVVEHGFGVEALCMRLHARQAGDVLRARRHRGARTQQKGQENRHTDHGPSMAHLPYRCRTLRVGLPRECVAAILKVLIDWKARPVLKLATPKWMPRMTTFSTNRQLVASPATVFGAMKDPVRLAQWWGPAGFSNRFDVFEFHSGGKWIFSMIGPDGTRYQY